MKEILDRISQLQIFKPGALSAPLAAAVVAGGLLLIGVIVWANVRKPPPPPLLMPDGTPWVCKNGHEFTLTSQQLADHQAKHSGEPVLCPVCGAESDRAVKCPHCEHMVVPGPAPDHLCPVCKNPILHY